MQALISRHGLGSRTVKDFRLDAEQALAAADKARAVTDDEVITIGAAAMWTRRNPKNEPDPMEEIATDMFKRDMRAVIDVLHAAGMKVVRA